MKEKERKKKKLKKYKSKLLTWKQTSGETIF